VFHRKLAEFFDDKMFPGGLTYSGHPLAMASINAALQAMEDEGMVDNAQKMGDDHLRPGLLALQEKHPVIGDVRGLGCFFALELVEDRVTKKPVEASVIGTLKTEMVTRGLLPFVVDNRIHVVPPLIVNAEQVDQALAIYDDALEAAGF
ncbi:MAG: hypothetical protein RL187_617, partial [Actinomycetota bacterium]